MGDSKGGFTTRLIGRKGLNVPYTLKKTLESWALDPLTAPGAKVLQAIAVSEPEPPPRLRCVNPTCTQMCEWTGGRGRLPKFCSDTCRQQHDNTRKRLVDEIDIIEESMDHPATGPTLRRRLNSERSKRTFVLYRYPDVREPRRQDMGP